MKEFFKRRKKLLFGIGIPIVAVGVVLYYIFLFPKTLDFIYWLNDRKYEPGVHEYYDVAVEFLTTNEEIKEKYGEDFTFYLMGMEYERNHTKNEGEAEVEFWIKGRRHVRIYLEWQDGEWVVVDRPKKWRHDEIGTNS